MKRKNKNQKKLELHRQVVAKLVEIRKDELENANGGATHFCSAPACRR